jgi:hypothetical protein
MGLVYIGAWSDFSVVRVFPSTQKFIFVDTQPRNEFDDDYPIKESLYERPYFLQQIFDAAEIEGFELISKKVLKVYSKNKLKNPTLYNFKSNNQEIDYYVSSNFRKDNLPTLNKEINKCDGIIISGYYPHYDLLKLMKSNINIYLMSGTYYSKIDFNETGETENNIINFLYDNEDLTNKDLTNKDLTNKDLTNKNKSYNLFQVFKNNNNYKNKNKIIQLSKISDIIQ